jgi:hypothetical protein
VASRAEKKPRGERLEAKDKKGEILHFIQDDRIVALLFVILSAAKNLSRRNTDIKAMYVFFNPVCSK